MNNMVLLSASIPTSLTLLISYFLLIFLPLPRHRLFSSVSSSTLLLSVLFTMPRLTITSTHFLPAMIFSVFLGIDALFFCLLMSMTKYLLMLFPVFLGIRHEHRSYRCYDPTARRVCISCHIEYEEFVPYFHVLSY